MEDLTLIDPVRQAIVEQRLTAEDAWRAVVDKVVLAYRALEDAYMQERAVDMIDLGQRVVRQLAGVELTRIGSFELD